MTDDPKPSYGDLEQRLAECERYLEAIRRGEVDVILGEDEPIVLRPRELEHALRESEKKYRTLYNSIRDAILVSDQDRVITDCNPAFSETFGYQLAEIKGKPTLWLYQNEADFVAIGKQLQNHGEAAPHLSVHTFKKKDGQAFPGESIVYHLRDEAGQLLGFVHLIRDVTERVRTERALRKSEAALTQAQAVAKIGSWEYNLGRRQVTWSREMFNIFGRDPALGPPSWQALRQTIHPQDVGLIESRVRRSVEQANPFRFEFRIQREDATHFWAEALGKVHRNQAGEVYKVSGTMQDISQRKEVENALRDSQANLTTLIQSTDDIIVSRDKQGRAMLFNQGFTEVVRRLHGMEAEQGINTPNLLPPEASAHWWRVLDKVHAGQSHHEHFFWDFPDGRRHYDLRMNPIWSGDQVIGSAEFTRDITEQYTANRDRERLRSQLLQAQKMEAIGTLAGGIAHDFNNILGAIIGYCELAQDKLTYDSEAGQYIKSVLDSANRAKELTRQILSFSRETQHQRSAVDMEPITREIVKMLRATLPSTIEIRQDIPRSADRILADPVHIHQIVMNLCTNAAQAMEDSGGVLSIALDSVSIDETEAGGYVGLSPGRYQRLSVGDTGVGMPREVVERIFEPFFTTKEVGKGTGMGLSVVHGIVRDYGGAVTVYSEPGQGSTFHVYLPLAEGQAHTVLPHLPRELPTGHESILLVDDEAPLVDVGSKTLSRLGYRVTGHISPLEALKAFQADPEAFDLLITDYTMPKLTGVQLAQEILALKPGMPVIMCTGFSERLNSAATNREGITRLAMKPLMAKEIARLVREVLDRK